MPLLFYLVPVQKWLISAPAKAAAILQPQAQLGCIEDGKERWCRRSLGEDARTPARAERCRLWMDTN
jgi:hypothetical protein